MHKSHVLGNFRMLLCNPFLSTNESLGHEQQECGLLWHAHAGDGRQRQELDSEPGRHQSTGPAVLLPLQHCPGPPALLAGIRQVPTHISIPILSTACVCPWPSIGPDLRFSNRSIVIVFSCLLLPTMMAYDWSSKSFERYWA